MLLTFILLPSISRVRTVKSTPMVFCWFSANIPDLKLWTTQVLPTSESPTKMILNRKSKLSSCSGPVDCIIRRDAHKKTPRLKCRDQAFSALKQKKTKTGSIFVVSILNVTMWTSHGHITSIYCLWIIVFKRFQLLELRPPHLRLNFSQQLWHYTVNTLQLTQKCIQILNIRTTKENKSCYVLCAGALLFSLMFPDREADIPKCPSKRPLDIFPNVHNNSKEQDPLSSIFPPFTLQLVHCVDPHSRLWQRKKSHCVLLLPLPSVSKSQVRHASLPVCLHVISNCRPTCTAASWSRKFQHRVLLKKQTIGEGTLQL